MPGSMNGLSVVVSLGSRMLVEVELAIVIVADDISWYETGQRREGVLRWRFWERTDHLYISV